MVHIAVLTLGFHLEGCSSLKEKRQRLGGLRERFGRLPGLAVCESGLQDAHQSAEWTFVAVGSARGIVDRLIAELETQVAETLDARVTARQLELL
jgi:uncharacterized protein YlxP (DUF503 family)